MTIRVMVVDDLPDMRTLLGLTLRRNKWTVIEARNGEQAVELAKAELPDVILMDYDMPRQNGLETCKKLAEDETTAKIPVIIYTGFTGSHIRSDALAAGAKAFIVKPITPAQLREEIENVLKV